MSVPVIELYDNGKEQEKIESIAFTTTETPVSMNYQNQGVILKRSINIQSEQHAQLLGHG